MKVNIASILKVALTRAPVLAWFVSVAFGQTGTPGIAPFDQLMNNIMTTYGVPGGSMAITRNGHLIMARGYGLMDQDNNTPAQPDTLYRIASLSKSDHGSHGDALVEQGSFRSTSLPSPWCPIYNRRPGKTRIPGSRPLPFVNCWTIRAAGTQAHRISTLRGGQAQIAAQMGVPSPVSGDNMVRYMRGYQNLDFTPGQNYAYSNFGYDLLGRIIERVTGVPYEQYVRTNVLAPMGITSARIAQTLPQGQLPNETNYYANQKSDTIFPNITPKFVSVAYGGSWYMEGFDADGGWVISAIDYAKFINSIDGQKGIAFLKPSTVATMTARPNIPYWNGQNGWYTSGLVVQPTSKGQDWWNDGAIDGTYTYFFRNDEGVVVVVFFNSRSNPPGREAALASATSNGINDALSQVTSWPTIDYIVTYPDANPTQAALKPALVTSEGVRNGATMDRGIVSGSWATLFGVNLSKTTRSWTASDFTGNQLPTSLDGVSVKIAGQAAPISYISPTQINVQVPSTIEPGWVTVQVTNDGVDTTNILTWVTNSTPGIFSYAQNGVTFAAAAHADGSLVTTGSPAIPGEVISIYGTGVTTSTAGVIAPPRKIGNVSVEINGLPATVEYSGLVGPGLFQINALVPNVAAGNQPIYIDQLSTPSQVGVSIPIGSADH